MKPDPIIRQQQAIAQTRARIVALRRARKGPGDLDRVLKDQMTKLLRMQVRADRRAQKAA